MGVAYVAVPLLLFPLLLLLLLVLPAYYWHVGVPPIPLLLHFVHCFIHVHLLIWFYSNAFVPKEAVFFCFGSEREGTDHHR